MSFRPKQKKQRELILRGYQVPASDFAMEHDMTILAMCPGSGKTETAIDVIRRVLTFNPKKRVLILTHSRNEIKKNFMDRLDELVLPFTYSDNLSDNSQVHICLPQNQKKIIGTYDFLIVDEAHQNYLPTSDREYQVQKIIRQIKPDKQLLLTGSPSKFIKKGIFKDNIFFMPINEIPEEYFAKLQIELVAHKAYWKHNRNPNMDLKTTYKHKKTEVIESIEKIIEALLNRLSTKVSAENFNRQNLAFTLSKLLFNKIGKTIFYCKSTDHANMVYEILKSKKINCALSHSKNKEDIKEEDNLTDFYNNKFDVLVVVRRATLGYSDDDLFNIVDMSGTHNIDTIYQIMSRIVRGTPEMKKFYLKLTTTEVGQQELTTAYVGAALLLTDRMFLSKFNGDNFNAYTFIKKNKTKTTGGSGGVGGHHIPSPKVEFPPFADWVDAIGMLKDAIGVNLNNPATIYKLTTIGEVRAKLSDKTMWTLDYVIERASGKYAKINI